MFEFRNLKYSKLRRGVYVQGDVYKGSRKVGDFEQQPYAACIASIPASEGSISCDEAERLLEDAEDKLLAKGK